MAIADQRLIIDPSGAVDSVDAIKNLLVSTAADGKIIYLKDIAKVYRDYKTPASKIIRYNGKPAIALGVANVGGGNVVVVGATVDEKLRESISRRPLGMEVFEYYHQGKIVEASVDNFVMNVISALIIVILLAVVYHGFAFCNGDCIYPYYHRRGNTGDDANHRRSASSHLIRCIDHFLGDDGR